MNSLKILDYDYHLDAAHHYGWHCFDMHGPWYAPDQKIPKPDKFQTALRGSLRMKLLLVYFGNMVIQFEHGNQNRCIVFDPLVSDPIKRFSILLDSFKKKGCGHLSLCDSSEDFFFGLHIWSLQNIDAYVHFIYADRSARDAWHCLSTADEIIHEIENLFQSILHHPDFMGSFAFFPDWSSDNDFVRACESAWENEKANIAESGHASQERLVIENYWGLGESEELDDEDTFNVLWLRENLMSLPKARLCYEYYWELLNPKFEVPIDEGFSGGATHKIFPVDKQGGAQKEEGITLDEDDAASFLCYFFNKYFDKNLRENVGRDEFETFFNWWGENYYTLQSMRLMLEDMRETSLMLKVNYDDPMLEPIKERFSLYDITSRENPVRERLWKLSLSERKLEEAGEIIDRLDIILDFYDRFTTRIEKMLSDAELEGWRLVCFYGP